MLEGVTVSESKNQKDELILEGADIQNVSQSGTGFCIVFAFVITLGHSISGVDPRCLPSAKQRYSKVLGWYLRVGQDNRCAGQLSSRKSSQ